MKAGLRTREPRRRAPVVVAPLIVLAVVSGAPHALHAQSEVNAAELPVRPVAFRADPMSPEFGRAFDLHVTLRVAPGTLLLLPDTLVPGEASQSAGGVAWRTEPAPGDSMDVVATYPVMGLANGEVELPSLEAATVAASGVTPEVGRLGGGDGSGDGADAVDQPLRPFALRIGRVQVIPHRTLGDVEGPPLVRPPSDVSGGNWSAWAIVAGLIGVGVLALVVLYGVGLWRRVVETRRAAGLRRLPRRDALAALEALRGRGWHRAGRMEAFYQEASEIFRGFAAKAQSAWSEDLTSTELVGRIADREGPDSTGELRPAVIYGEGVRFGSDRPESQVAEAHVDALARWIATTESAPGDGESRGGPSASTRDRPRGHGPPTDRAPDGGPDRGPPGEGEV